MFSKRYWPNDETELQELNHVAVRRREFIAYATSMWKASVEAERAVGDAMIPLLSVVEVISISRNRDDNSS